MKSNKMTTEELNDLMAEIKVPFDIDIAFLKMALRFQPNFKNTTWLLRWTVKNEKMVQELLK